MMKVLIIFLLLFSNALSTTNKNISEVSSLIYKDRTDMRTVHKFYNHFSNTDIDKVLVENVMRIQSNHKICVEGKVEKLGNFCDAHEECGGICANPKTYLTKIYTSKEKQVKKMNFFKFNPGIGADMTCTGFTVGISKLTQALQSAIVKYVTVVLPQKLTQKIFGLPDFNSPGAMAKWAVEMMAELMCGVYATGTSAVQIAGEAIVTQNNEIYGTTDMTLNAGGTSTKTTADIFSKGFENYVEVGQTGVNTQGSKVATSKVLKESLKAISKDQQICVKKIKELFNFLTTVQLDIQLKTFEAKTQKTLCEIADEIETIDVTQSVGVSFHSEMKKSQDSNNKEIVSQVFHKEVPLEEIQFEIGGEEGGAKVLSKISEGSVKNLISDLNYDNNPFTTYSERVCFGSENHESCTDMIKFVNTISKCTEYISDRDGVMKNTYICEALNCEDKNKPCHFESRELQGQRVFPFIFQKDTSVSFKSFLDKLTTKKKICNFLETIDDEHKLDILSSFDFARKVSKMTTADAASYLRDENKRVKVKDYRGLRREGILSYYNLIVKDYCGSSLHNEVKIGNDLWDTSIDNNIMKYRKAQIELTLQLKKSLVNEVKMSQDDSKRYEKVCAWRDKDRKTFAIKKMKRTRNGNSAPIVKEVSISSLDVTTQNNNVNVNYKIKVDEEDGTFNCIYDLDDDKLKDSHKEWKKTQKQQSDLSLTRYIKHERAFRENQISITLSEILKQIKQRKEIIPTQLLIRKQELLNYLK